MRKSGELTERDRQEIEKFTIFLRLRRQAIEAGVPAGEADPTIYEDVYGGDEAREETSRP